MIGKYRSLHQADEVVQDPLEAICGRASWMIIPRRGSIKPSWVGCTEWFRIICWTKSDVTNGSRKSLPRKRWMSCALCRTWWEAQSAELQEEKIDLVGGALRQLEDEHPQAARLLRRRYWDGLSLEALAAEKRFLERN